MLFRTASPMRDSKGRQLEDVGEMPIASNPLLEERPFRKRIGDDAIFLAGLFPERVARINTQRRRLDFLVDYLKAGQQCSSIIAAFNEFEYRDEAPVSKRVELSVFNLNLVKQDLDWQQNRLYTQARTLLT